MAQIGRMKLALTLTALLASSAAAQSTDGIVQLEVLPGWQTDGGQQMAGLRITLAPGWKTYWRAPGDAGIPPRVDFSGSDNVASARFFWPVPEVFDQNGMRSIGYHDQVVIPVEIARHAPGPMRLSGGLEIGVCEEICIPMRLAFDAALPTGGARDPAIVAGLVNRPMTADEAGVRQANCQITPTDTGLSVRVFLTLPPTGTSEVVVIEAADPEVWVSEADVQRTGPVLTATSDMVHMVQDAFAIDRSALRFTVLGDNHAVDIHGCTAG